LLRGWLVRCFSEDGVAERGRARCFCSSFTTAVPVIIAGPAYFTDCAPLGSQGSSCASLYGRFHFTALFLERALGEESLERVWEG
jgi:hypothetical protein